MFTGNDGAKRTPRHRGPQMVERAFAGPFGSPYKVRQEYGDGAGDAVRTRDCCAGGLLFDHDRAGLRLRCRARHRHRRVHQPEGPVAPGQADRAVEDFDRLLASVPIAPERFATYSSERKTLVLTERDASELAAAVKALTPSQLAYPPRSALAARLPRRGRRKTAHDLLQQALCAGRGRAGYIDGDRCSFSTATVGSPALVKWLQKRLVAQLSPNTRLKIVSTCLR